MFGKEGSGTIRWFKSVIKDLLLILAISLMLLILIDIFIGARLLAAARGEGKKDSFRTAHATYHHTLIPNYDGPAYWGPFSYRVCTNSSAMKDACSNRFADERHFDIAFIGDSFTEGVGVPYEESFVGMFANAHPELKIANLGVVSYSPTIYLKKLEEYFTAGYTFKKVIVFVDIGDIMDEAFYSDEADGKVVLTTDLIKPDLIPASVKQAVKKILPLTYEGLHRVKLAIAGALSLINKDKKRDERAIAVSIHGAQTEKPAENMPPLTSPGKDREMTASINAPSSSTLHKNGAQSDQAIENSEPRESRNPTDKKNKKEPWIYEKEYTRSAWTYNVNAQGYGDLGVQRAITKSVKQMTRLAELVKSKGASLSVGVYPWPAQLIYDTEESLQVQIWRAFCENRCEYFYNAFPLFFKAVKDIGIDGAIYKYYFAGDMHFNKEGNGLVAETLLQQYPRP